ncbi:efflux RND transporter periplasmic adaptor subunit [Massilibacteroides sp.]|uniref:efflux RND transporter periplasmic adaptor subunit n=1 Tax=Massilibacteroides sp. TaxID=2034766 RepID=UPI00260984DC|nr:efflux RND transporter periplasmic adaptor subunit [Massilibacteroides sp.]MDD4516840.1 efflux RND transporter periplasmic adaptor subunit [Massilibacteroides sp.]
MKRYLIYGLCLLAFSWGCNSADKQTAEQKHEHSHEGHNHDHGDEEYDHDHEGHNHDHEGHTDEILFTEAQAKACGLEVVVVEPESLSEVIKTSGQILSATGDEITVAATTSGIVTFYSGGKNPGLAVRSGEALVAVSSKKMLDGDPMLKAQSAYQIAEKDFKRADALIKDKLISEKEYNEIKLAYENARIAYDASAGKQSEKGTNITSPINGFIKNRLVNEGDYVEAGTPLFTITQNRKLQLRADVSESHYNKLKSISSANFRTPYSSEIYKLSELNGRLVSFGKSAGGSYYIPVFFDFDNVGDVLPGAYTEVFLLGKPIKEALTVPVSTLTEEQGLFFVYVQLDEEGYQKREVKTGISNGEKTEILSGISEGEKVVSKGAYHIKLSTASASIPHGHEH